MTEPAALRARLCRAIEHTALAVTTSAADVARLCDDAVSHGFHGVCVQPVHVADCVRRLGASHVRVVTVVGFPLGCSRSAVKAAEAELAASDGAHELDMVQRVDAAREGAWDAVQRDIEAVVAAAPGVPLKVILETGLLTDEQKRQACERAVAAGAAFVKTCTGFGPGQATVHDVALLASTVRGKARVKASGGIRTLAQALALLDAGAVRLGTSAGVAILAEQVAAGPTA